MAWPGHEVMRRDLALAEFRSDPVEKQRHCRAAICVCSSKCRGSLRRKHPPNFRSLWIRIAVLKQVPASGDSSSSQVARRSAVHSSSARKRRTLSSRLSKRAIYAVARARPFVSNGRVIYAKPDHRAGARIRAGAAGKRLALDRGSATDRGLVKLSEPHIAGGRPQLVTTRGVGADARSGFLAPWHWPPRKDGTISNAGEAA